MSIQRYHNPLDVNLPVRHREDGELVYFEQHEAIVAEMQAEIDQFTGVNEVLMRERNFDPGAANVLSGFIAERNRWMTECDWLRGSLIIVGRKCGCLLEDSVSTDFLMYVPDEVAVYVDRLKALCEWIPITADMDIPPLSLLFRGKAEMMIYFRHALDNEIVQYWDLLLPLNAPVQP